MSTLKVNTIQSFTGTAPVVLNDEVGISGSLQVSGSITPKVDDQVDLGSSTKQWKDLYIDGTANIDYADIYRVSGSLIPREDDTLDLGAVFAQWKDLYIDGTANIDAISIGKNTGASQDLASSAEYSLNGSKVVVKAITAAQINDGAFATFKLLNTSISTGSIVHGAFVGNHSNTNMSGSILSVATIAASTASVFIHNETGGAIAADTPFTASFVIL